MEILSHSSSVAETLHDLRTDFHNSASFQYFHENGYLFVQEGLDSHELTTAREHLTSLFQGVYDRGEPPTKPLRQLSKTFSFPESPEAYKPPQGKQRTLQMINAWHADSFYYQLCTSPILGELVARVSGWEGRGCRLAQDQVWVKPPGTGPLTFHRDTTYFDMLPKEVTTVWFTLDELEPSLGPLEYCVGSHWWSDARRGSANQFFDPDYRRMLRDAAEREVQQLSGETNEKGEEEMERQRRAMASATKMDIVSVAVSAGGFSIHSGRLWHGSGPNTSTWRYRRGIGIHFVPGDAKFNLKDLGSLWGPYVVDGSDQLDDVHFPWVYRPTE